MGIDIKNYSQEGRRAVSKPSEASKSKLYDLMNKDIQLFGNGFGLKKKQAFYADLRVLLDSGLDIQRALELIGNSHKKTKLKALLEGIKQKIIEGNALSEALRSTGKFSDYEVYSIQIGEESGQLLEVLEELSIFFAKSIKYRQQLIGALSYPLFVIGFAVLVIIFMLNYLVPLFSDIYQRIGSDLPTITTQVVALSDWLKANLRFMILAFFALGFTLYYYRQKTWLRKTFSALLIRTPIFGGIIKMIYLSRLCQSMFLLLGAKVPLLVAVDLVKKMIAFYPIEQSLTVAREDILNGAELNGALSAFAFYPEQFIALLKVGEESGNLERMFQKLAEQYNNEVEQRTAVIGSLIEPILIIGVGALVGGILIAMYLPLFQMSSGIG